MPTPIQALQPSRWVAVTPSDSTDLTGCVGLYVGTSGDVAAQTLNYATTVTFSNVPDGSFVPGNFTRVMAATTATNILAAYA